MICRAFASSCIINSIINITNLMTDKKFKTYRFKMALSKTFQSKMPLTLYLLLFQRDSHCLKYSTYQQKISKRGFSQTNNQTKTARGARCV